MKITVANIARAKIPAIDFDAIKNAALGARYDLTLAIASAAKIRKLNMTYRGQNKPTDILSFPLSKKAGEIYVCPSETKKAAIKFRRPYENFFAFLFIHGCAHLKGCEHGDTMERLEARLQKRFGI
jgi:probable rRNA maturation factor